MEITHPFLIRFFSRFFLFLCVLLIVSGCKNIETHTQPTRIQNSTAIQQQVLHSTATQQALLQERMAALTEQEKALVIREQAISERETELVNLLSELLHQKKALEEISQAQLTLLMQPVQSTKKQTSATRNQSNKNKDDQVKQIRKENQVVLGELENVYLDPPSMTFGARIDTGAETSSLNAIDLVELERDGKPYVKFNLLHPKTGEKIELTQRVKGYVHIKEHFGKAQRRPVVKIRVQLDKINERIEFTLADRSRFKQQILLGRNFLRDIALVDVSKKYTAPTSKPTQPGKK